MYISPAICITCGSTKSNETDGYCVNDHDNWLEPFDESEYFEIASKNLGATFDELRYAIENNVDITPKKLAT